MPRLIFRTFTALLLSLPLHLTQASASQDGSFSPRFLLRDYIKASQMLGRCPEIAADQALSGKRKDLELFANEIKSALTARSHALQPNLDKKSAKAAVDDWISNQIFELTHVQSAEEFCASSDVKQLTVAIDMLVHPSVLKSLKDYGAKDVSGLAKVPFEGSEGAMSFALPEFQEIALGVLKDHHFPADCGDVTIDQVEVAAHSAASQDDIAPFEIAAMRVSEVWTASCGGESKAFAVEFDRSLEDSFGRSIVVKK